jgi:molybdate transport system substrate-binding protein
MWAPSSTRIERPTGATVCLVAAALALAGCHRTPAATLEPLKVGAAADLSSAFKDVGDAFQKQTGREVLFTFGSTGLLEKQVAEGAPFDVFAAADIGYANDAVASGACPADSKTLYASGHLVMYAANGASFAPRKITDLTDPRITKIAIANPDHAPYGKAARQAMQHAGIWDAVEKKVVYGENVRQALQFAETGNADAAVVALSQAMATPGQIAEVPAELHDPIDQAMVACVHGKAGADAGRTFIGFVMSQAGRAVMRKYGFRLPGESVATGP